MSWRFDDQRGVWERWRLELDDEKAKRMCDIYRGVLSLNMRSEGVRWLSSCPEGEMVSK